MIQYVELGNVPEEANHLMNILWNRNREMSLRELAADLKSEYSMVLDGQEMVNQMELLVDMDYVERREDETDTYYVALGWQEQF